MPEATVIQQIVAPAVMIPACGLLLLSTTARLNSTLGRLRAFHHEQLEIWRTDAPPGSRTRRVRDLRLEGLEAQGERLLRRIWLMRTTMLLLFGAITCNILASLALAGEFIAEEPLSIRVVGVVVFVIGLLLMLAAMVSSAAEVSMAMGSVRYEHERVRRLVAEDPEACPDPLPQPAPSRGEVL